MIKVNAPPPDSPARPRVYRGIAEWKQATRDLHGEVVFSTLRRTTTARKSGRLVASFDEQGRRGWLIL